MITDDKISDRMQKAVSVIIHDLKSPLCGISGFAQLIQKKAIDDQIKSYNGKLLESLERIDNYFSGLLAAMRGDVIGLKSDNQDLQLLVSHQAASLRDYIAARGIGLHYNSECDRLPIIGDAARLNQAINAVLFRTLEYTDSGRDITIVLKSMGSVNGLEIKGEGKEISSREIEYLFEPFYLPDSKGKVDFSMALAKAIIVQHGGRLRVSGLTAGKKGISFTIELPKPACAGNS